MSPAHPQETIKKWRLLADMLISLTNKGVISWEETPSDDEFVTSVEDNAILLRRSTYVNDEIEEVPIVEIIIQDNSGKTVESFNDEDISASGLNYYRRLDELVKNVQRKLSGAEERLDRILAALSMRDPDDIPF